jgi:hypothetical protein
MRRELLEQVDAMTADLLLLGAVADLLGWSLSLIDPAIRLTTLRGMSDRAFAATEQADAAFAEADAPAGHA